MLSVLESIVGRCRLNQLEFLWTVHSCHTAVVTIVTVFGAYLSLAVIWLDYK